MEYYGYPNCYDCNCEIQNTISGTNNCNQTNGDCGCKENYRNRCDECSDEFYDYPDCIPCNCLTNHTRGNSNVCAKDDGPSLNSNFLKMNSLNLNFIKMDQKGACECKENYMGLTCNNCQVEYYDYPNCYDCNCEIPNTINGTNICNQTNGDCKCKQNFTGRNCSTCAVGYFDYPNCKPCLCNEINTKESICDKNNGTCHCLDLFTGESWNGRTCNECADEYFGFPNCTKCLCNNTYTLDHTNLCDKTDGTCKCMSGYGGNHCNNCADGYFNFPTCKGKQVCVF